MVSFRYKQVEAALAAALEIATEEMGAFRARLRHLRNLGLPRLPAPGSGRRIAYTEGQAFKMLIALELEDVGLAPRSAAAIADSIARSVPPPSNMSAVESEGDAHVAITPRSHKRWTALYTRAAFDDYLKARPPVFSLLNLSICARTLDRALRKARTSD